MKSISIGDPRQQNRRSAGLFFIAPLLALLCSFGIAPASQIANIYINVQDIYDLNLKEGTVKVDFFLIEEFDGDSAPSLDLANGTIENVETVETQSKYVCLRYKTLLRTNFNYAHFPLDRQEIKIGLEAREDSSIVALNSVANQNGFADSTHLMGWRTGEISPRKGVHSYREVERSGKAVTYSYSRINFLIPLERVHKWGYFFKMFLPTLISLIIIFIGFIIPNDHLDSRLNVSLGSLFVIVSNLIITQQMLPSFSTSTLIEKLNYASLSLVVAVIFLFSYSFYRSQKQNSLKLELFAAFFLVIGYAILVAVIYF